MDERGNVGRGEAEAHILAASTARRKTEEAIVRYTTAYPFRPSGSYAMLCPYCCKTFDDVNLYREHLDDDDHVKADTKLAFAHVRGAVGDQFGKVDITMLKCRICHVKFDKLHVIAEHLREKHNIDIEPGAMYLQPYKIENNSFICGLCDADFHNLKLLGRHFGGHYIKFTCDVCGKGFTNAGTVKRHKLVQHSEKKFSCQKCLQFFDTKEEKQLHVANSPKCWVYCCTLCPERFQTYKRRLKHLSIIHGQAPKATICRCGEKFESAWEYYKHNKKSHELAEFTCSYCGMKCISKGRLEDHLAGHMKGEQFPCSVCDKVFFRKKNLTQHMWIHSERKRFVCKLCDKTFNQNVCYRSHMKTHHPGIELS